MVKPKRDSNGKWLIDKAIILFNDFSIATEKNGKKCIKLANSHGAQERKAKWKNENENWTVE